MDGHGDILCQQSMCEGRLVVCGLLLRRQISPARLHKEVATMLRAMCQYDGRNAIAIAGSDVLVDFMSCIDHSNHAIFRRQRRPCVMTVEFLLLLEEICTVTRACHLVSDTHNNVVGKCAIFLCLLDILCQCHRMRAHYTHVCSLLSIMHSIAAVRQDLDVRTVIRDHPGTGLLSNISWDGAGRRYGSQVIEQARALFDLLDVHTSLHIPQLRPWPPAPRC